MRPVALTILSRAPEAGRVKTRLARDIGPEAAAALHEAMALDVLARLGAWATERGGTCVLALTGDAEAGRGLETAARAMGHGVERQAPGDVGARIELAVARRLERHDAALVVGTDAPLLGEDLLDAACHALLRADAVLAPAADGGFVLVGARVLPAATLSGIPWGTDSVLSATCAALRAAGLSTAEVAGDHDVDDIAGLLRLSARPDLARCPRTAAWVAAWRAAGPSPGPALSGGRGPSDAGGSAGRPVR